MPRTLKFKLLGSFQALWSDDQPVEITSKKAQALLAYLAVERRRPQTREVLASLLWGDTGEERARHNLRQALSKIRQCCGWLLISNGDYLELDTTKCWADVDRFESLASSDDPEKLRECLDLYQGELLEGLNPREPEYQEWLLLARTRLRSEACQVATKLAKVLYDQGRIKETITAYCDLLTIDPAHEVAHRQLMGRLAETGRRFDALRQYQRCVEALDKELGAEPSVETKQLYAKLCLEDPASAMKTEPQSSTMSESLSTTPPAVAVLPFDNLSTSENTYFADGIAEDLITALSRFHSLVVIARGSSFAYRESELTDKAIATELGAQYLVRGSVQRLDNRVRINVQLLDAEAGLHAWGQRYDREQEDIFLLQDEITSTLVSTLAGRVEAARLIRARRAPTERLDAHDLLLRGKDHHHRFTPRDCEVCIDMFERAIERDPDYATAYAWLACGLGQAIVFELGDANELDDQCQVAVEKGLELDENDSECHRILAQVQLTRGNINRALQHQERALFLNPNDDRIVNAMGEMLLFAGYAEEAEQWVRKSMCLNPYHPPRYWTHLVRALFHQDRYDDALKAMEHIDKPRKDDIAYLIAAMAQSGDREGAAAQASEFHLEYPDFDLLEFVNSLPFMRKDYRKAVLEPLTTSFSGSLPTSGL